VDIYTCLCWPRWIAWRALVDEWQDGRAELRLSLEDLLGRLSRREGGPNQVADLTEDNPNVLFELGVRMREDRSVALVRARGSEPIFDVDNMVRVEDYIPNLWPSTVKRDVPRLTEHLKATWENRGSVDTFMKILRRESGS
jgi:hypothetical protein